MAAAVVGAELVGIPVHWLWEGTPAGVTFVPNALTAILVALPLAYFLSRVIAQLREQESSLRRREHVLLAAQNLAHLGHWRWELASDTWEWSDSLFAIAGVPAQTFRPTLGTLFELVHPDDAPRVQDALSRLVHDHTPQEVEYRVVGYDGVTRDVWADGRCEFDAQGRLVALYGVCQDITGRKSVEAALRQERDRAEAASRAKSVFLASMSHELRTPLNAIIGFSDMMRSQTFGPVGHPRYREYATDIHDSGRHLLALIDDLMDLTRIEAGRFTLNETMLDVGGIVNEAAVIARAAAGGTREVAVDLDPALPPLRADARMLRQVLLNLVGNALKFADSGPIVIEARRENEGLSIRVADSGPGIPADVIPRLGQPFMRVDDAYTRRREGTGIGLYITRTIVEAHGGRLTIASKPGEGTRVTVWLPEERLQLEALRIGQA